MLEAFLKSRRQGISNHTLLFYQTCLNKAIGIDLTPVAINWFLSTLSCKNGKFAYYRAIRALCNWLTREDYIAENPINRVDAPKVTRRLLPSITDEQLQILLNTVGNIRDKCIIRLLFDSGLRLSEICRIKLSDVNWANNTLRVVVKGNREAKAAFTAETDSLLKEHISSNPQNKTVFNIKPRGIQDMLTRLSQLVGFPCNAHSFRRGFACNLHKKGLSTLSIMHLGRWSSLDMVSRYCRSINFDDCLEHYRKLQEKLT